MMIPALVGVAVGTLAAGRLWLAVLAVALALFVMDARSAT